MTDKEKIRAEIVKLKYQYDKKSDRAIRYEHPDVVYQSVHAKYCLCKYLLEFIDSLQEDPVSENLEEASRNYADNEEYGDDAYFAIKAAFKVGAKWQKEQIIQ